MIVLLAGASGWLGRQTLQSLRSHGAEVRAILRGGASHQAATQLQDAGAVIVDASLANDSSLARAAEGVDVIVSTLSGGPDVIVDGQAALARAGRDAGAARIFTSDFSVRFDGVDTSTHLFLGWREQARLAIADTGLPQVRTLNGAFMEMLAQDFFGLVDWQDRSVKFWGDADQSYDFTLTSDVARYVAAAALDSTLEAGNFEIVGDTASPRSIAALLSATTGKPFALRALGGLADLDAEIARRQAAHPNDPRPWAGLQYHRLMANGSGKLNAPQNARYAAIAPSSIKHWLETRGSIA